MTAFGFCVVAALSSQISGRPFTSSCRMGKSLRINRGSSGRLATPKSAGSKSGRNSKDSPTPVLEAGLGSTRFPPGGSMEDPGIAGVSTPGICDDGCASIASDGFVGIDDGRTGTPGGDCTPGTPGSENISLADGKFVATPGYTALRLSDEFSATCGRANGGSGLGTSVPDSGAFLAGAAGIVPRTGCDAGTLGCDFATSGTPGTDAPGTRGNENTSSNPAKCGSAAQGSVRLPFVSPAGEDGAAAKSEPPRGPVGGDEGTAGTPGKEYISAAGGIC